MNNAAAFGQQIVSVQAAEAEVQGDIDELAPLVVRLHRVNLLRLEFGPLYVDPQLILGSAFAEGFATLNEAMFEVEARLEQHEATLWSEYGRLAGMRAALTPQVGQVNQLQQQAAPAPPAPAPAPQPAVPVVNGPPPALQTLPPGYKTWAKQYYCSVCLAAGRYQRWDHKDWVVKHGRRRHPGALVVPTNAPSKPRR